MFSFLFFSGKQTQSKMANLTDADKIAHYWARQTSTAISWTGGLAFLVALITLCFNIWKHFSDGDEEEKRRRRANALDEVRRRAGDRGDVERRQRADEEDERRRARKEEEEAEREEAGREAKKREAEAAEQLKKTIAEFRYARFNCESSLSHPAL